MDEFTKLCCDSLGIEPTVEALEEKFSVLEPILANYCELLKVLYFYLSDEVQVTDLPVFFAHLFEQMTGDEYDYLRCIDDRQR